MQVLFQERGRNMGKAELSQAAIEAKRAYNREWRRRNPEKVKAAQMRHWEKKARELREQEREHGNKNAG